MLYLLYVSLELDLKERPMDIPLNDWLNQKYQTIDQLLLPIIFSTKTILNIFLFKLSDM